MKSTNLHATWRQLNTNPSLPWPSRQYVTEEIAIQDVQALKFAFLAFFTSHNHL